jgi:hypothetical protein
LFNFFNKGACLIRQIKNSWFTYFERLKIDAGIESDESFPAGFNAWEGNHSRGKTSSKNILMAFAYDSRSYIGIVIK